MNKVQQTLKKEVSVSGKGLHSGKEATVTIIPAPPNHGLVFERSDLEGKPKIEAIADYVVPSERSTKLDKNGILVITVEHILSALAGMEIDNALISLDNEELPILDGSAKPYVNLINEAGIKSQDEVREIFNLDTNLSLKDPNSDAEIIAMPAESFNVKVLVDYKSEIIGPQHASLHTINEYEDEISPNRTFVFFRELETLNKAGLIKGGDVDNAVVIVDKEPSKEEIERLSKLFNKKDIEVQAGGCLNNVQLHFQNEPARHKLLDLIGDLSLVGMPINAHIFATYPGHKINTDFAKLIRKRIKEKKTQVEVPPYDPAQEPIFDIHEIQRILPHRFPMLLVDKVIEINEEYVVGIKNATINEHFFSGHFPNNHVMPGVLQIEAMAQCGGMLALQSIEDTTQYDVYFLKIDKAKFKRKVVPGDTLIMKVELLRPIRRGIVEMKGTIFVGNQIATEAEMMATIIKKTNE